ncbi:Proteasome subunit beta type-1 [Taenia crassiceps]|uniref:Proteasome subunit beta type-1 n=1 Tax=Taenia crassiceps TaxID=6207 RepID=A0ABR4QHA1_9CEST
MDFNPYSQNGGILLLSHLTPDYRMKIWGFYFPAILHTSTKCCALRASMAMSSLWLSCWSRVSSTILAGIDEDGKGAIYSFDPVGSYAREVYRACGTGGAILQPLMDSQLIALKWKRDLQHVLPGTFL